MFVVHKSLIHLQCPIVRPILRGTDGWMNGCHFFYFLLVPSTSASHQPRHSRRELLYATLDIIGRSVYPFRASTSELRYLLFIDIITTARIDSLFSADYCLLLPVQDYLSYLDETQYSRLGALLIALVHDS